MTMIANVNTKPAKGNGGATPAIPADNLAWDTDATALERQEAMRELHRRMRMIIGYAEIVQAHLDMFDTIGALQAYDKLRGHMIACTEARKKI